MKVSMWLRLVPVAVVVAPTVGCDLGGSGDGGDSAGAGCVPQEKKCDGSDVVKCNSAGTDWAFYKECPAGCSGGQCKGGASCTPACEGRTCGDDGCGGNCGTCGGGAVCYHGSCCKRSCLTVEGGQAQCGDDGCGGTCGSCSDIEECFMQECCKPKCIDLEGGLAACGDNGCGGSCGECSKGQTCVNMHCEQGGTGCVPQCDGLECGEDGCGGSCGECPDEQACNYMSGMCYAAMGGSVDGTLSFEVLWPSVGASGGFELDDLQVLPAEGMLAVVFDGDGNPLGATPVAEDGSFSLKLDYEPTGDESVVFAAVWAPHATDDTPSLAVLKPASGGEPKTLTSPLWAWQVSVGKYGWAGDVVITVEEGSGAIFAFLFTKSAMEAVIWDMLGGNDDELVSLGVLWSPGVAWECGACYSKYMKQNVPNGWSLAQSIFLPGGSDSASAWGYPTILHEFGHYVAKSYSRDDSPGGTHYFGTAIAPPFAWSEGWASFFAVATISRWSGQPYPVYWDIQGSGTLWVNYASGKASGNLVAPDPEAGMYQNLDENWVAGMLWDLWDGGDVVEPSEVNDGTALGTAAVLSGIVSQRFMNGDRGATGADFVDFVDSEACLFPSLFSAIYSTVVEYLGFPYDGEPSCQ